MGWALENLDVQRATITNGREQADGKRNYALDHWCGLKELDENHTPKGGKALLCFASLSRLLHLDTTGVMVTDSRRLLQITRVLRNQGVVCR